MKAFSALYRRLDETTKTNEKVAALSDYFQTADPQSAAWAIYFLTGRKLKRVIASRELRDACRDATGLSEWLFEESYEAVGDLAEVVAILLPETGEPSNVALCRWIEDRLMPMRSMSEPQRQIELARSWSDLDRQQRFVWNKLLTGAFRVGVSRGLVVRGLAAATNIEPAIIEHRLMGDWTPSEDFFQNLLKPGCHETDRARPYPFCLAHALQQDPATLGAAGEWIAEWKWDGIRAQMVRRGGQIYLWSRGEELISEQFPDLHAVADGLPDGTVLDGEIVVITAGQVQPFTTLQKRLNRKQPGKKVLSDAPASFIAFDLLEDAGQDIRPLPFIERRERLERVIEQRNTAATGAIASRLSCAQALEGTDWNELAVLRARSREHGVEGLMFKRRDSPLEWDEQPDCGGNGRSTPIPSMRC